MVRFDDFRGWQARPRGCAVHNLRISAAESGLHSAGLWTIVQPAASAGAIFHVDSMKGVFQA